MSVSFSSSIWPDPQSPVLSKIDFGVPLVELFKWLEVRDYLLGQNSKDRDIPFAVELARDCKHPDAVWLTSIFEGEEVSTSAEEARKVLLLHQNDARALCFAWCLTHNMSEDLAMLRRAADMGYAFACSTLCEQVKFTKNSEEIFRLARVSAVKHERDGFFVLARCFHEDLDSAKENYLLAAELGHDAAADRLANMLDNEDPVRWLVMGKAKNLQYSLLLSLDEKINCFFSGPEEPAVTFAIGCVLKGNINAKKKQIFGASWKFNSLIGTANRAVSFYDLQIKCARLAVHTWTLVATRLSLIKDMRIYIGKMIWERRSEANYV